jgi:hypothetical protein
VIEEFFGRFWLLTLNGWRGDSNRGDFWWVWNRRHDFNWKPPCSATREAWRDWPHLRRVSVNHVLWRCLFMPSRQGVNFARINITYKSCHDIEIPEILLRLHIASVVCFS